MNHRFLFLENVKASDTLKQKIKELPDTEYVRKGQKGSIKVHHFVLAAVIMLIVGNIIVLQFVTPFLKYGSLPVVTYNEAEIDDDLEFGMTISHIKELSVGKGFSPTCMKVFKNVGNQEKTELTLKNQFSFFGFDKDYSQRYAITHLTDNAQTDIYLYPFGGFRASNHFDTVHSSIIPGFFENSLTEKPERFSEPFDYIEYIKNMIINNKLIDENINDFHFNVALPEDDYDSSTTVSLFRNDLFSAKKHSSEWVLNLCQQEQQVYTSFDVRENGFITAANVFPKQEEVGSYPIISKEEAIESFKLGKGTQKTAAQIAVEYGTYEIVDCTLQYDLWQSPVNEYIVPIYVVWAELGSGNTRGFVIPAIKEDYLKIVTKQQRAEQEEKMREAKEEADLAQPVEDIKNSFYIGSSSNPQNEWVYYTKVVGITEENQNPPYFPFADNYDLGCYGGDIETSNLNISLNSSEKKIWDYTAPMEFIPYYNYNVLCKARGKDCSEETVLYDKGYVTQFIQHDDWIYFIDDSVGLCKIKTDGTGFYKFSNLVTDFGIFDDSIYFNKEKRFVKTDLNGKNEETIFNKEVDDIEIADNMVYFTSGSKIYRTSLNAKNGKYKLEVVCDDLALPPGDWVCEPLFTHYAITVSDGWIYYPKPINDDINCLYRIKTDGSKKQKILSDVWYDPIITNDHIYYASFNEEGYEEFYSLDKNGKNKTVLYLDLNLEDVIIKNNKIYYLYRNNLYSMNINGTNEKLLFKDFGYSINISGDWLHSFQ